MTKELLHTKLNLFSSSNARASSENDFVASPPILESATSEFEISMADKSSLGADSFPLSSSRRPSQSDDQESSRSIFSLNLRRRKPIKPRSSSSHQSIDGTATTKQQHASLLQGTDSTINSISNNVSDVEKSPRNSNSKDFKDLTSETSSVEDPYYHHYRHLQQQTPLMSSNDIARITKALTSSSDQINSNGNNSISNNSNNNVSNSNNSNFYTHEDTNLAVPANMNPVSRLLQYSEATLEACEVLGRTMVQNVDSTTIQSFLDNFISQHPLEQHSDYSPTKPSPISLSSDDQCNQISPSSTMTPGIQGNTAIPTPSTSSPPPFTSSPTSVITKKGSFSTKLKPSDRQQQQQQQQQHHIKYATPASASSSTSSLDLDRSRVTLDLSLSMRRKNAIKELMQTESKYLDDLRVLVTHFFEIIKDAKCITREDRKLIMRNGEAILRFQEKFAEALEYAHGYDHIKHQLSGSPNVKNIAQCFIRWGPRFDIYMDYCVGQDKAVDVYRHLLETNDAFSSLMEKTHGFLRVSLGFGLGSKLSFDDYLITPFQRVFRYRLMLQSISKTSKVGSEETVDLKRAQDVMHDIATRLNTAKSRLEAEKKTDLFLARLKSDWTIPRRWHSTLGPCVLIGTLEVRQVKDGRKPKRYGCALFGTYMIIVKAKKGKSYYEPRHWFPLRIFELENTEDSDGSMTHAWKLYNEHHAIEFGAMCEQEKHIWLEELRKAIDESKAQYETHLWDTQNRGNVIEQLFVSSFDQVDGDKSQNSSPASNISSVASPRSILSRQDSTTALKSARVSKLFFPHQQHTHTNRHKEAATTTDDPIQCSTPSSITLTTASDMAAVTTMYPNLKHLAASQGYQQQQPHYPNLKVPVLPIDTSLAPTNASQSSFLRHSQSSMNDLRDFFHSNVASKWSQRKYTQYQSRRVAVDAKFEDVSTTPILTARSQARQDRKGSFEQWRRRSTLADDTNNYHAYSQSQSSGLSSWGTPRSSSTPRSTGTPRYG